MDMGTVIHMAMDTVIHTTADTVIGIAMDTGTRMATRRVRITDIARGQSSTSDLAIIGTISDAIITTGAKTENEFKQRSWLAIVHASSFF